MHLPKSGNLPTVNPKTEVLGLGRALKQLLEQCHTSAREASQALGFAPAQLTLILNGRRPMRVRVVFALLEHLGARPIRFFDVAYPLGGVSERLLREEKLAPVDPPGAVPFHELARRLEEEQGGPLTGDQAVEKLGWILRRVLKQAGLSQRQVSRSIGPSKDALGHALRGDTELNFLHIFGVLAATGRTPARLFAELFARDKADPVEKLEQQRFLDDAEALHQFLAARLKPPEKAEEPPKASRPGHRASSRPRGLKKRRR